MHKTTSRKQSQVKDLQQNNNKNKNSQYFWDDVEVRGYLKKMSEIPRKYRLVIETSSKCSWYILIRHLPDITKRFLCILQGVWQQVVIFLKTPPPLSKCPSTSFYRTAYTPFLCHNFRRLTLPTTRWFVQQLVKKKPIKAPHNCPFMSWWWIPSPRASNWKKVTISWCHHFV